MNPTTLKLTDAILAKFQEALASASFQEHVKAIKESTEDNGTFEMIISTDNQDRHGEIVDQSGLDMKNYMTNPIVLWGHNHYEIPIGITEELYTKMSDDGQFKMTIAKGRFAGHAFAQEVRKLYDAKILRTASIGFIPQEYNGNRIIKSELLEWSFVSVPANQYAVSLRELGLEVEALVAKGILENVKEGEPVKTKEEEDEEGETTDEPNEDDLAAIEEEEVEDGLLDEDEKSITIKLTDGTSKKFKVKGNLEIKAGRVLSSKNLATIKSAITALQDVVALAESDEDKSKADEDPKGGDEQKSREIKEAEDFLKFRKDMQGVATILSDVLAAVKAEAQEHIKTLKSS